MDRAERVADFVFWNGTRTNKISPALLLGCLHQTNDGPGWGVRQGPAAATTIVRDNDLLVFARLPKCSSAQSLHVGVLIALVTSTCARMSDDYLSLGG